MRCSDSASPVWAPRVAAGSSLHGKHYVAGSAVTRAGGLRVAKADTDDVPRDLNPTPVATLRTTGNQGMNRALPVPRLALALYVS